MILKVPITSGHEYVFLDRVTSIEIVEVLARTSCKIHHGTRLTTINVGKDDPTSIATEYRALIAQVREYLHR